jgi:hypothetical protein
MRWIASGLALLAVSGCAAQQMNQNNQPAPQLTTYSSPRTGISKQSQTSKAPGSAWTVVPFTAESFDRTTKFMGILLELHGDHRVLHSGAGGLIFTVDGNAIAVSAATLAHSRSEPTCNVTRCTASWIIEPKTPGEESTLAAMVKTVANGHRVHVTLLPGDVAKGKPFTTELTDEQRVGFHEAQQYYESLALSQKFALQTSAQ